MAAEQGDQSGVAVFDVTSHRYEAFDNMDGGDIIEGKVDWKGRPATKQNHGGLFTSTLLLVALGCNQMAVFAIMVNLVSYLSGVMHLDIAESTNALTNFLGTSSIIAFFLAYLADSYIGRCRTLSIGTCVVLSGFILMTFQALVPSLKPAPCNIYDETTKCEKVEGGNAALLYVAMYFVALGLSGIRSSGPVHGADQFDQNDPKEAMQMSSFFNWLLLAECVGGSISLSLIVWVQTNIGWDWGFGISTIASLMCAIVFFCGMPRYRIQLVQKTDAVIELFQVFVAAFQNRNLCLPQNHEELYEIDRVKETSEELEFLPHKDRLRFLDKAAIQTPDSPNPWRLCRVTQVCPYEEQSNNGEGENISRFSCFEISMTKGELIAADQIFTSKMSHDFYVGGSEGWVQNPSENHNHWAGRNRFQVNDSLVFSYKKGEDSLLVVNKEDYDKCNTKKPISNFSDGYSVFKFDRSGPFFFISGMQEKCEKGEKMIVVVLAVRHPHTPPISPPPSAEAPTSPSDSPGEKYAPAPSPTPSDSPGEKYAPAPSPKTSSAAASLLFSWTSRFYFVGVVVAVVFGSFVGPF